MTWIISKITIQGVKGVLDRAGEFVLKPKSGKPRSVAIFGRNGCGKSGYADAIEYLFSIDGGVEHLGKGGADSEQGGKHAIPHVLASEKGIIPLIEVEFMNLETSQRISAVRHITTGRVDNRPNEVDTVIKNSPAHRILRQHDLRRFVVDLTPGQKFEEFSRWIGLEKINILLKHLTTTERTLHDTDVDREINERAKTISDHICVPANELNRQVIYQWCENEVKKHNPQIFKITKTSDLDQAIQFLREKREHLAFKSEVAQLYANRDNLQKINAVFIQKTGSESTLQKSLSSILEAEKNFKTVKQNAIYSVFQDVWESSESLLSSKPLTECPVCQTKWENTKLGTQERELIFLRESLSSLAKLKEANQDILEKRNNINSLLRELISILTELRSFALSLSLHEVSTSSSEQINLCNELIQSIEFIEKNETNFQTLLKKCQALGNFLIPELLSNLKLENLPTPISEIDISITHLLMIQESLNRLESLHQQQIAIREIENRFLKIATHIRNEIKAIIDTTIDSIRDDVTRIYKKIHPGEAVPNILIQFDAIEKVFSIRVNFHSKDRIVPPGGYLSEAQINTIGLALFLSSVRLFNKDFPFLFLDDIVSSYDADCRTRIVDVIAEEMKDFQIILTTHDERFYTHLKSRLESENWLFERILSFDFEKGPKRESDNLRKTQIDEFIKEGDAQIAGNSVRQYIEDWFNKSCEHFYVYTLHKTGIKEYKRTLFDFWGPFEKKIQNIKDEFGELIIGSEEFSRFQGGLYPIVNYYSHNQTNPYEWSSIGDVDYLWKTFLDFCQLFHCKSCGKLLSFSFEENKFYCTCGKSI